METGLPAEAPELEVVHAFAGPMPTGVAVSRTGRVFVNFPKWGDEVEATVVELRDGKVVPFPDQEWNSPAGNDDADALVSVQSVVVDPADRLWVLDTGSPMFQPTSRGGPKLACVDLETDVVVQTIVFEPTWRCLRPISTMSGSTYAGAAGGSPTLPTPLIKGRTG